MYFAIRKISDNWDCYVTLGWFLPPDHQKLFFNMTTATYEMDVECGICSEIFSDPVRLECGHCLCNKCWISCKHAKPECPYCRRPSKSVTPAFPEANIVKSIPRVRACGAKVSDRDLRTHERSCMTCVDEYKRIVNNQITVLKQELVKARAECLSHQRANKRKRERDEDLERENSRLKSELNNIKKRDYRAMKAVCRLYKI